MSNNKQTPKEKADDLIQKYTIGTWIKTQEIKYLTTIPNAKECALIAVDEIISNGFNPQLQWNYWEEVKQEINKL